MKCWTCGDEMEEWLWNLAPREPSAPEKRTCVRCHEAVEMHENALYIMNMVRYVAGLPRVEEL